MMCVGPSQLFHLTAVEHLEQTLKENNIFTVAKRNIDGQELMYQSVRLVNGIWCLVELTLLPASSSIKVEYHYNLILHIG